MASSKGSASADGRTNQAKAARRAKEAKQDGTPPCCAGDLRRLAEAVDGYRGTPIPIYRDPVTGELTAVFDGTTMVGKTPILVSNTVKKRPLRLQPRLSEILKNIKDEDLANTDALFWSEAAVEKFVWPYYKAHRIDVKTVRKAWDYNDDVVAILHLYPTRAQPIPFGPTTPPPPSLLVGVVTSKEAQKHEVEYYTAERYEKYRLSFQDERP